MAHGSGVYTVTDFLYYFQWYKPNSLTKSLATGPSNTIGLIVENIGDSLQPLAKSCVRVLLKEIDRGITRPKEYVISTNLIKR